jgi:hypothetical protein
MGEGPVLPWRAAGLSDGRLTPRIKNLKAIAKILNDSAHPAMIP